MSWNNFSDVIHPMLKLNDLVYFPQRNWYPLRNETVISVPLKPIGERTCLCVGEHSCSSQTPRKGSESTFFCHKPSAEAMSPVKVEKYVKSRDKDASPPF